MTSRLIFLAVVGMTIGIIQLPWAWHRDAVAADALTSHPKLETGMMVTFESLGSHVLDTTSARLAALCVPAGSAGSPFLPVGAFRARFVASLVMKVKQTRGFLAQGRGSLQLTINGQPVLNLHDDFAGQPGVSVELHKGLNSVELVYTSPANGAGQFRLLWAETGRPADPIPPTFFQHDQTDASLVQGSQLRAGRELVATLHCLNCHTDGFGGSAGMPELGDAAPDLADISHRLRPGWIAHWISHPHQFRPVPAMPAVFGETDMVDGRAVDIAAYLSSADAAPAPGDAASASAVRGARLFTSLGCIACHVAPNIEDSNPALNRVPLKFVRAKFQPAGLNAFLKNPQQHYAANPMPNFHLSEGEVGDLTDYLLAASPADSLAAIPPGNAQRGKGLMESTGCLNCHVPENHPPMAREFSKSNWSRGCMSDDPAHVLPGVDYHFSDEQRADLRALAAAGFASLHQDTPTDFAARNLAALRCNACHAMDGRFNIWSNLDSDIAAIEQNLPPDNSPAAAGDQNPPALTFAGDALKAGWAAGFIAGKIPYNPRPWLAARMPGFAAHADVLAAGLAAQHGWGAEDAPVEAVDPQKAGVGQTLCGRSGFSCVSCHSVADQPPLAAFEGAGPNLAYVTVRLRHDYYLRWMRHPLYYIPGTRMTQFADATGHTVKKEILDGDAGRQFEAIWQYLLAGSAIIPPP